MTNKINRKNFCPAPWTEVYIDFDIEAKHKEIAIKGFYDFIKKEEEFAGETISSIRIK